MNILNISYDSDTKSFSINKEIEHYGFVAIQHINSTEIYYHNNVNFYDLYVEDNCTDIYTRGDALEIMNHGCDYNFSVKKLRLCKTKSELDKYSSQFSKEVDNLNNELKRKGTFKK